MDKEKWKPNFDMGNVIIMGGERYQVAFVDFHKEQIGLLKIDSNAQIFTFKDFENKPYMVRNR